MTYKFGNILNYLNIDVHCAAFIVDCNLISWTFVFLHYWKICIINSILYQLLSPSLHFPHQLLSPSVHFHTNSCSLRKSYQHSEKTDSSCLEIRSTSSTSPRVPFCLLRYRSCSHLPPPNWWALATCQPLSWLDPVPGMSFRYAGSP